MQRVRYKPLSVRARMYAAYLALGISNDQAARMSGLNPNMGGQYKKRADFRELIDRLVEKRIETEYQIYYEVERKIFMDMMKGEGLKNE